MLKIYRISTESGEYNFKTNLEGTKLVKESFTKLYEKRLGRSPQFVELLNEGILDFFKKKKKNNNMGDNKAEQNKVTAANNKKVNKGTDKLFKELENIKNQVVKILKSNDTLFKSSDRYKNIKEHILYVGKYLRYACEALETARYSKNIEDNDIINSVPKAVITVRNMIDGENYKKSNPSEEELKKAYNLLNKVQKNRRNKEWKLYFDFIKNKLKEMRDTTDNLNKSWKNEGAENNEEVPVKKKKNKKKQNKSNPKEEEECVKNDNSSKGNSSFKANTTSWF